MATVEPPEPGPEPEPPTHHRCSPASGARRARSDPDRRLLRLLTALLQQSVRGGEACISDGEGRGAAAVGAGAPGLLTELEVSDAEGRSLLEYRREMDLLLQEKLHTLLEQGSQQAEQPPAPGRSGPTERPEPDCTRWWVRLRLRLRRSYGGLSAGQPHRVMVLAKPEARSSQMVAGGPSPPRSAAAAHEVVSVCHQQIHRNAPICPL
ncbi:hypothetical protein FJT64_000793 [Amphibalanus amphitrite]|uniref:Uncharacterized protein n=1 Tax=Amphibalanus amphitrite TaxID=1232801 RepID=A0A6A4VCF9_AMPAM|nr:hypothetical protein FJT64_000793 [Amphibalanus amphitrite]